MQTLRHKQALLGCKVNIGANYTGPRLDRPALRAMPRDWKLHTNDRPRQWLPSPDKCVAIAAGLAWIFAIAVTANWIRI
jgi:hypothetical protein